MDEENFSNVASSNRQSRIQKLLSQWDVIFLLMVFAYLMNLSLDLPEEGRRFPMVFLGLGIIALSAELVIEVVLPPKYSNKVKRYLEGITGEVEQSFTEETGADEKKEEEQQTIDREEALANQAGITLDYNSRVAIIVVLICGYGIISYLIGILYAIPFFVFPAIYLAGSQRFLRALIVTIITTASVYFLFGSWMNVPIFDGVLL